MSSRICWMPQEGARSQHWSSKFVLKFRAFFQVAVGPE